MCVRGSRSLHNFLIVPPGGGIVHQVNLEFLSRSVFNNNGLLYPDSVVGTDSHTTMINGLGVVGWGVGGIEAEAVMLGQPISMVLPEVVGFRLTGKLPAGVTATDLVLTITEKLRQKGVVDKFVEFYGPSLQELSLADRATISNMGPEYGATVGFFPVDSRTIEYLRQTNRDEQTVRRIEAYLRANEMFIDHSAPAPDAVYTSTMELDLSTVSQQHTSTSHSSNTTRCPLLPAAHGRFLLSSLFVCVGRPVPGRTQATARPSGSGRRKGRPHQSTHSSRRLQRSLTHTYTHTHTHTHTQTHTPCTYSATELTNAADVSHCVFCVSTIEVTACRRLTWARRRPSRTTARSTR